jgi:hypothetical protein
MDGSTLNLADRLHRERTEGLERAHEIRRSIADRGVVVEPSRPVVTGISRLGVWFRGGARRPRVRLT